MVIPMTRKKDSSASPRKQKTPAEKTHGGIIIPESAKVKPSDGEVAKVSPKRWRKPSIPELSKAKPDDDTANGKAAKPSSPLDVKASDRVLFGKWAGVEIKPDSALLSMKEADILGVIGDGPMSVDDAERQVRQKLSDAVAPLARDLMSRRMATDEFAAELRHFAQAYFERHDEANPPPVPERRFTPRKDQILDFLKSVWGEWIGKRLLTKPLLKAHDDKAYDALMNWQRGNTLPEDVYVPTQKEANDRFLKRRYFTVDECHRVVGLLTRRDKDGKQ